MKKLSTLFFFLTMVTWGHAQACSCADWESASEMMKSSDAVFIGIPESKSVAITRPDRHGEVLQRTNFSVVRGYKNVSKKSLQIYTNKADRLGANCGVNFDKDEDLFLIFAHKDEKGRLYTDGCSLSGMQPETYEMIRGLNKL